MAWGMTLTPRELEIRKAANERCNIALRLREEGHTYRKIGEIMGVSRQRACELVWRAQGVRNRRRRIAESIDRIEQGR